MTAPGAREAFLVFHRTSDCLSRNALRDARLKKHDSRVRIQRAKTTMLRLLRALPFAPADGGGASPPTINEEAPPRPPLGEPLSSPLSSATVLGRHEQHASASHGRELQSSGSYPSNTICGHPSAAACRFSAPH